MEKVSDAIPIDDLSVTNRVGRRFIETDAQDLEKLFHSHLHHVANNLLEVIEYVALVRDVCHAFNIPPIPTTVLENGATWNEAWDFRKVDDKMMPFSGKLKPKLHITTKEEKERRAQRAMKGPDAKTKCEMDEEMAEPERKKGKLYGEESTETVLGNSCLLYPALTSESTPPGFTWFEGFNHGISQSLAKYRT
ncbi:hypothetical protein M501DRAFT_988889 [Patellaria atrata CBS 101060]|uniref:Uncharacterized protein n=1 Tax=Patellaria atrata CBS 101060 TaxID=1346257 RepID=A0A9P4S336_9PEZI|nr:hypothetical protein M501DRAFT_988889 [Patellaria atrata CBS 101060]